MMEVETVERLSSVEIAIREVEQGEALLRSLRSELTRLPDAIAEVTAALDGEALKALQWKREALERDLLVNKRLLNQRRLNLLKHEREQLDNEKRGILDEMSGIAQLWQEAADLAVALRVDHNKLQLDRAVVESRIESNRQEQLKIETLIKSQQEI